MKSANQKQLTRAKEKKEVLIVIGTIHLALIEIYDAVYRGS